MMRRSGNGPVPCFILVAVFALTFALMQKAAAAQDAASNPGAVSSAPRAATETAGEPESHDKSSNQQEGKVRKRERARFRLRDASWQYGRKFHVDFKTRMRGEFRTSDATISKDALDTLDIARRRIGVEGEV